MNTKTKLMICAAGIFVLVPALLGGKDQKKDQMPRVKIETQVEVVNKYNDVAKVAPTCPRTTGDISVSDSSFESEYEHCKECQTGVFFKKNEQEVECSFCLKIRKV